jgi:hypothetical protein
MRVYVASKFENRDAVRLAQAKVIAAGHEVTFDWTDESNEDDRRDCAEADMGGATSADVLLLLADYDPSLGPMKGALIEAGMALASGAWVFHVSRERIGTIFDALEGWHDFETLDLAIAALEFVTVRR